MKSKFKFVFKHNDVDVEIVVMSFDNVSAWRMLRYILGNDEKLKDYEMVMPD